MKYAKRDRCDGGYVFVDYDDRLWKWKLWSCGTCNVLVLPYHSRKLSIPWLMRELKSKLDDYRYQRKRVRGN